MPWTHQRSGTASRSAYVHGLHRRSGANPGSLTARASGPRPDGSPTSARRALEIQSSGSTPTSRCPSYAHPGDAGADLVTTVDVTLAPGERAMVPTGIALALPDGYVALVHPRSGLAARHGLSIVNTPGTIDAGYRGEIKVMLINHDPASRSSCAGATGSPSWWSSGSSAPGSSRWTNSPTRSVAPGGYGSTGGFGRRPERPDQRR